MSHVDLGDLGLDRGGHLLIKQALSTVPVGGVVQVTGQHPELPVHLPAWCRAQGHEVVEVGPGGGTVRR
ncbi:MAG: sulfurtransferase TusA family protein, partial [Planctomycetota bacterium]|nr:sulfurtransferase TusA family protein [Planctomycetota bacterium]